MNIEVIIQITPPKPESCLIRLQDDAGVLWVESIGIAATREGREIKYFLSFCPTTNRERAAIFSFDHALVVQDALITMFKGDGGENPIDAFVVENLRGLKNSGVPSDPLGR